MTVKSDRNAEHEGRRFGKPPLFLVVSLDETPSGFKTDAKSFAQDATALGFGGEAGVIEDDPAGHAFLLIFGQLP